MPGDAQLEFFGNAQASRLFLDAISAFEGLGAIAVEIDLAPFKKVEREINVVLSNSYGFGGTNASVIFGRID